MRRASVAEASSNKRLFLRLNLSRSNRVGARKFMSLFEAHDKRAVQRDSHLPQLYAGLNRLCICVAILSEVDTLGRVD